MVEAHQNSEALAYRISTDIPRPHGNGIPFLDLKARVSLGSWLGLQDEKKENRGEPHHCCDAERLDSVAPRKLTAADGILDLKTRLKSRRHFQNLQHRSWQRLRGVFQLLVHSWWYLLKVGVVLSNVGSEERRINGTVERNLGFMMLSQ